jgi:hypothetical protein
VSRQQLRERNDQLLRDYDAMAPGRRFHLIGRYGFKDMRCVYSQVWIIRKRREAEEARRVSEAANPQEA